MKTVFTVDMAELRRKVGLVKHGLGTSKTDLAEQLFRFETKKNKAVLFAADKETFARAELKISPADKSKDGSFSVLGQKIISLCSQVEVESVTFEADGENLKIAAGFLTVNLETYDGSTLKTVEKGVSDFLTTEGLAVNRDHFLEALACAKSCTTTNHLRPDLTHAELRKGRMLSSDGRKIMIYAYDGFPDELGVKIPAHNLGPVINAMKAAEVPAVQVIEGPSYFYFKGNQNEYAYGIRKVERSFPQVEEQILSAPEAADTVVIDKNVLETMLRGVALGLPSEEVRVNFSVEGDTEDAKLTVSATNSLGRESFERADCGRQATKAISFPISFKHMLDTLGVFKGDSVVDMFIVTDLNLLMVRDHTDAREVLTVIPFRTDQQIEEEKREAAAAAEAKKKEAADSVPDDEEGEDLVGAAVGAEDSDLDLELDD